MNSTGTPLRGDVLLINQLELVTPTTVAGALYGIAFTLFCLYAHSLAPQLWEGDRKRRAKFMLGYSTIIMLCGMYYLVSNAWVAQDAYIKHSNYRGGPELYIVSTFHSDRVIAVGFVCQVAVDILTSAIQIWRVWVIWSATRYANLVVVLPILCFLTFTGSKLMTVILDTTLTYTEALRQSKTEVVEMAIQGTTTILCTLLISLYLVFQQWRQRKLIGKTQGSVGYMSVVAMIIESYALESIWLLVIAIILNQPALPFFTESVLYIEIISYLLVQYRVDRGKGYESQRGRRNISSLRWNHSNHATTQFGESGDIQGGPYLPAIPGPSSTPRVFSMA